MAASWKSVYKPLGHGWRRIEWNKYISDFYLLLLFAIFSPTNSRRYQQMPEPRIPDPDREHIGSCSSTGHCKSPRTPSRAEDMSLVRHVYGEDEDRDSASFGMSLLSMLFNQLEDRTGFSIELYFFLLLILDNKYHKWLCSKWLKHTSVMEMGNNDRPQTQEPETT